jgi:serine phosphatase RsbU (regulator of sigma subunit)
LDCGGMPAGMFASSTYEWRTLKLQPGDIGILVTDGISEAVAQDGIPFAEVLRKEVIETPTPRSPESLCERIMLLAKNKGSSGGDPERTDDQTVLAFVVEE